MEHTIPQQQGSRVDEYGSPVLELYHAAEAESLTQIMNWGLTVNAAPGIRKRSGGMYPGIYLGMDATGILQSSPSLSGAQLLISVQATPDDLLMSEHQLRDILYRWLLAEAGAGDIDKGAEIIDPADAAPQIWEMANVAQDSVLQRQFAADFCIDPYDALWILPAICHGFVQDFCGQNVAIDSTEIYDQYQQAFMCLIEASGSMVSQYGRQLTDGPIQLTSHWLAVQLVDFICPYDIGFGYDIPAITGITRTVTGPDGIRPVQQIV